MISLAIYTVGIALAIAAGAIVMEVASHALVATGVMLDQLGWLATDVLPIAAVLTAANALNRAGVSR